MKNRNGFTLIELMIIIAIIGFLSAIAIPNFLRFQLQSKTSEVKVNIAAIQAAQENYYSEFGTYIEAKPFPTKVPGTDKVPWSIAGKYHGFSMIGWSPENPVRFQYAVKITENGEGYTIEGVGDLDGDGRVQRWTYVKPSKDGTVAIALSNECARIRAELWNMVTPCDVGLPNGDRYAYSVF